MSGEPGVPVGLARLWGLSEPSRRGRPAELDGDRVVQAAVELADRDGLDGVTLPKVAAELGFTSMSLYRYVGSKDELLVLMRDVAVGEPPELDRDAGAWRESLRRWADAQHRIHRQRPWLARVPVSGPPAGPHEIAWMDRALAVLRDTGLGWADKIGVLSVIGGHIRHSALLAQELAHGRDDGVDQAEAEARYGRALRRLVDPDRFPEAATMFASAVFEAAPASDDPDFAVGLELILDGVQAAIERVAPPGGGRRPPSP